MRTVSDIFQDLTNINRITVEFKCNALIGVSLQANLY